jgi:hypothetical protein
MAPDLAEKLPSYELLSVMVHGIKLAFIHGKMLNEDASKLSLTLPALKEKSLSTI